MSTGTRMPFTPGHATACVRVFPEAFVSFGQVRCGCRLLLHDNTSRIRSLGNNGFSPSCRIRGRNSRESEERASEASEGSATAGDGESDDGGGRASLRCSAGGSACFGGSPRRMVLLRSSKLMAAVRQAASLSRGWRLQVSTGTAQA